MLFDNDLAPFLHTVFCQAGVRLYMRNLRFRYGFSYLANEIAFCAGNVRVVAYLSGYFTGNQVVKFPV